MPRKLSEIRQFTPKNVLQNIDPDPAKNTVLANAKKLYDELEAYPNDLLARALRQNLDAILKAHAGKMEEEIGNINIEGLSGSLYGFYLLRLRDGGPNLIGDEQKRKELQNLIQYTAGGFGYEQNFGLSQEQKNHIMDAEAAGRTIARAEQLEAEKDERRLAVEGKSGYQVLEEYKTAIGNLPRTFRGPGADINKATARQQLKGMCLDILATRRAIDAQRNDAAGLKKSAVDPELRHTIKKDFVKSQTVEDFLNSMSYEDLRSLASSGHGGKMEEKLQDYLRKSPHILADAPFQYMPKANKYIEALQDKMDNAEFKRQTPPGEQRKLYIELMAARAAVGAKRNTKTTLDRDLDANILDQERKKFEQEPLKTALARMTAMGDQQELSCDAALKGHGGGLEDRIQRELRRMALEEESGYRMQNVDERYAPTYNERYRDLAEITGSAAMPINVRMRAAVEGGMVYRAMDQAQRTPEDRINNVDSINRQTDKQVELLNKVMPDIEKISFVNNVNKLGYEEACKQVEGRHAGEIKAINLAEKLDEELAKKPEGEALAKLAAKKMLLLQHKMQFQQNKDKYDLLEANKTLADALDEKTLDAKAEKMMRHYNFKDMVEKLGTEGLQKQAEGDGAKLVESYALAEQDKLQPYKPAAAAPVKNGPVNENPQVGGPVA